jgi:DNA (cytosine-5)-methyltransferase 1
MKLGSLFDGSGGFPLAGALCGIEPIWASEIEPYPIAVTKSRLPNMRHLGDISKINGANIEPVDIITFGSPCQDLSVAGKRAGLKHEDNGDDETTRSGLFMEAVRIITEMRGATNGEYPKIAVWENVPGAFSSNKGEDFRTVLEELIKIVEPNAVMPDVPKKGWAYADCYRGDGWSLAYRVLDAQYIRTAQRRRRIYLVFCLTNECAGEILFKRQGLRRYPPQSGTQRQGTATDVEGSIGTDDREGKIPYTLKIRSGCEGGGKGALVQEDKPATLACNNDQYLFQPVGVDIYNTTLTGDRVCTLTAEGYGSTGTSPKVLLSVSLEPGIASREEKGINCLTSWDYQTRRVYGIDGVYPILTAGAETSGQNQQVICYGVDIYNQALTGDKTKTLNSAATDADHIPCTIYSIENHPNDSRVNIDDEGKVQALTGRMGTGGGNVPMVMERKPIALDRASFNQGKNALYDPQFYEDGTNPTLVAKGPSAVCYSTSHGSFHILAEKDKVNTLMGTDYKDPPTAIYCIGNGQVHDALSPSKEVCKTLNCLVDPMKDMIADKPHYIVRRLTPTECARLQGFPDTWGHIEPKSDLTDEEYKFWCEVRNTHAEINGKQVKDYTKKQMLTWYNKLWTDSAEYKMWGNGIALPCALYVMEGIKEIYDTKN